MRFQQHRHDGFADLAARRAARIQEIILHQLLGERAAALLPVTGPGVDPQRPQYAQRIDAEMGVEIAVLDGFQRRRQHRRHLLGCDDNAILAMNGENAADQQRLEAGNGDILARDVSKARDAGVIRVEIQQHRGAGFVREARGTQIDLEPVGLARVAARPVGMVGAPVLQALQFMFHVRGGKVLAHVQLLRRGVHLRRQRPAPALELRRDDPVQVRHIQGKREAAQQQDRQHVTPDLQFRPAHMVALLAALRNTPQMQNSSAGSRRV